MRRLSRRTCLRGFGSAIALPLLEAMTAARSSLWRMPEPASRRFCVLYVPNGIHMDAWTPALEGKDYELPPTLEPLAPHRSELSVLTGLTHDKGRANGDGPGDHARACASFLTGAQPYKGDGSRLFVGVSADQVAAQAVGDRTRFRSLELGCDAGRLSGQCDSGYPCAYSSNLAWSAPHTPVTKEVNPRRVFDRLFLDGRGGETPEERAARLEGDRSVLDFVREEAKHLAGTLGAGDKDRLEQYLTGIREIERRIARVFTSSGELVSAEDRPKGRPSDYKEHIRLLADLLVLAFQSDVTRIATFLFADEGSGRSYPDIGAPEGHHNLSHHGGEEEKQTKIQAINRFHVEQLAYFLQRMRETPHGPEDGPSLLDQSMVVYGSGLADGNRHEHHALPILLAGRGGGTLTPGRHVRYPRETPATNLFLSLLDRMGAGVPTLGDSTGRLPDLAVF